MESKRSCCCCLLRPPDKGITTPYCRLGVTEIYSDMLADCFDLHLILGNNEGGICLVCVDRLIDASDFKKQVQRSQAELQECMDAQQDFKYEEPEIKLEEAEDNDISDGLILYVPPKSEVSDETNEYDPPFVYEDEEAMVPSQHEASEEMAGSTNSAGFEHFSHDDASQACQITILTTLTDQTHSNSRKKPHKREKTSRVRKENETRNAHRSENENDIIYPLRSKVKSERKPKLNNDYRNIYATGPYTCEICKMVITTRRSMACHMQSHTEPKSENCEDYKWDCDICGNIFSTKWAMTNHMLTVHSKKTLKCDLCSKMFHNNTHLNKHKLIHTERETNYCCEVCGKRYLTKHYLTAHIQSHTGYKPFSCDICQKKLRDKTAVRNHINAHMGVKPYTCNICNKTFITMSGYKRHDWSKHKNHSRERAFSCELCNKRFFLRHHLKKHKLTHTGEKPYACDTCGKRFVSTSNLRTHLLTHDKGTYSCELCLKTYGTKEGLRQHKRIHTSKNCKKDIKIKRKNKS